MYRAYWTDNSLQFRRLVHARRGVNVTRVYPLASARVFSSPLCLVPKLETIRRLLTHLPVKFFVCLFVNPQTPPQDAWKKVRKLLSDCYSPVTQP